MERRSINPLAIHLQTPMLEGHTFRDTPYTQYLPRHFLACYDTMTDIEAEIGIWVNRPFE